jgi:cytidylate kinase
MNYHDLSLSVANALVRSHLTATGEHEPAAVPPPFCITISREAGARGTTVATEVGRRLSWPVYDREILNKIAEEVRLAPRHVEAVDERPGHWLEECLKGLLSEYHVSSDRYFKYLVGTVRGLGAVGRCILVGRGANFILPAQTTLRVRLVADLEDRVRVIAGRRGLAPGGAVAWVKTTDRERFEFVKHNFGKDPTDPHHYDLVLNLSRLRTGEAADSVCQLLRHFENRRQAGVTRPEPATV